MKILHLCNKVPYPGRDGSSLAMEALIRLEVKAGHEVIVLALNTDKHFVSDPQPQEGIHFEAPAVRVSPSLRGLIGHLLHPASYFAARFDHAAVRQRISTLAKKTDLIVVDSLFMAVYRDAFGSTPWVLRAHNVEHQIWERTLASMAWSPKKIFTAWQTRRLKRWESTMIQGSTVWAISEEDAETLHRLGAKSVRALPCTYDPTGPWTSSGAIGSSVYHLGALDWLPNVQGLKWYLEQVHPHVQVPVTVISRHWPAHLQPPKGVTHLSRLEDGFSFEAHGIFIAPILSGSGMRIKLLEAMVRGKAIVTTSIGAEGLKNSPGITVVNEPQAFAAAIQHLVDDQAFRMAQGAAAQAHARATFADDAVVASLRAL